MSLSVAVRVDASSAIGTGHVMRCLTLADALAAGTGRVRFVSRHLPEHLRDIIRDRGHESVMVSAPAVDPLDDLPHACWLGTAQAADASETMTALGDDRWDLLIVDHYALDWRWESVLHDRTLRLLAIDDLADRRHACGVLLDQNVYADMARRYRDLVPPGCDTLLGPRYALVRPEFRRWRARVSPRRGEVSRLLVTLGGVDVGDLTSSAIDALRQVGIRGPMVDVVLGASHPNLQQALDACAAAGYRAHVQSDRMAELMAEADLGLGAAGSTSWERCCVGLPTLCIATAHNQQAIAEGLESRGASVTLSSRSGFGAAAIARALESLLTEPARVAAMSRAAWGLVDGMGPARVCERLVNALCK